MPQGAPMMMPFAGLPGPNQPTAQFPGQQAFIPVMLMPSMPVIGDSQAVNQM